MEFQGTRQSWDLRSKHLGSILSPSPENNPAALVFKGSPGPEVLVEKKDQKHPVGCQAKRLQTSLGVWCCWSGTPGPQVPPFLLRRQAVLGGSDKASEASLHTTAAVKRV